MCDASKKVGFDLQELTDAELPAVLHDLTYDERVQYILKARARREELRNKLLGLNQQRLALKTQPFLRR